MRYDCLTQTAAKREGVSLMARAVTIWAAFAHRPELDDSVVLPQDAANGTLHPINSVHRARRMSSQAVELLRELYVEARLTDCLFGCRDAGVGAGHG